MKVLVAPEKAQEGRGEKDFCWTIPGELLMFGTACDGGYPDDGCGCRRAFAGMTSLKSTTIGIVQEWTGSMEAKCRVTAQEMFSGVESSTTELEERAASLMVNMETIEEMIRDFPVGTRVGIQVDRVIGPGCDNARKIFPASYGRKYAV